MANRAIPTSSGVGVCLAVIRVCDSLCGAGSAWACGKPGQETPSDILVIFYALHNDNVMQHTLL